MIKVEPLACVGPCNRGKVEGEAREPGDPVWCRSCQRRIRVALTKIDELCTWVEGQADGYAGRTGGDGRGGGARRGGAPDLSPAIDLVDQVYGELRLIELDWRMIQGLSGSGRHGFGRTAYDRALVINFLQQHLASIMRHRKMIKPLGRILSYQVILQHMTHSEPARRDRPGRCPRCHNVNVLHTEDDDLIHCRYCPSVITEEEYDLEVVDRPDAAAVTESRRVLGLDS